MIPAFFRKLEQWQHQRLWRVGRYLWRRRYKPGLLRLRSRWQASWVGWVEEFPLLAWFMAQYQSVLKNLPQSWGASDRRLLLSLVLFVLAIGGVFWLDLARLQFHSEVIHTPPSTTMATVRPTISPSSTASPPPTSTTLFEEFASPVGKTASAAVPDQIPRSMPVSGQTPVASSPTPKPTPASSPTVLPTVLPTAASTTLPKVSPTSSPSSPPVRPPTRPPAYQPPYEIAWAHPSNFGDRFVADINGKVLTQTPLIVLHETVYSADSAINYFQTPHSNEDDQASYHTLIRLDGTVIYIVPPEKRAYGAGNSVFEGPNGPETAKTHAQYPPSVNNFAYHISLETPIDGENDLETHSGYTQAQYRSLVWLVAQSNVPDDRITTHRAIDRSGSRIDPRSFNAEYFLQLLHQQRSILAK